MENAREPQAGVKKCCIPFLDMATDEVPHGDRRRLKMQTVAFKLLTPLVWAPIFPVIRHTTARLQPTQRLWFIGSAILVANLHGFWLINNPDLSDEALGVSK